MTMHMSNVKLRTGQKGSTGALSAFLAGNAESVGQAHHLIWALFGDKESKRGFVYRMTGNGPAQPVLVYSDEPVTDLHGLWDVETKPFELPSMLKTGDKVAWNLRVNATRKIGRQRHDIVTRAKRSGDERHWMDVAQAVVPAWLQPKLAAAGLDAAVEAMTVTGYDKLKFAHDARRIGPAVTIAATDIHGTGIVTDTDALTAALLSGIGAGRAYGCGMLLIRQVH